MFPKGKIQFCSAIYKRQRGSIGPTMYRRCVEILTNLAGCTFADLCTLCQCVDTVYVHLGSCSNICKRQWKELGYFFFAAVVLARFISPPFIAVTTFQCTILALKTSRSQRDESFLDLYVHMMGVKWNGRTGTMWHTKIQPPYSTLPEAKRRRKLEKSFVMWDWGGCFLHFGEVSGFPRNVWD